MPLRAAACLVAFSFSLAAQTAFIELRRDPAGARPGSAVRYAAGRFVLWGFLNDDPNLPQEQPLLRVPEYDVVSFRLGGARWQNEFPPAWAGEWSRRLPLAYAPRTYSGITTGSERTVMRNESNEPDAAPRPDLNVVYDQVALRTKSNTLYYFTGGLTAAYDVQRRRWQSLRPRHSPPPVLGGSLAYDPSHDEFVLFGGGHVAEPGARGYTGTWVYSVAQNDWRRLPLTPEPPPRMCTRMVTDTIRNQLILFGGDSQTHYLADTWIFDLATRTWREVKAPGPPPRAGHFTVFHPASGHVVVGGGYNRTDLTDLWAFNPVSSTWTRLAPQVPTGFYLTADLDPETQTLLLVTSTRAPRDRSTCNILFPHRTTYSLSLNAAIFRPAGAGALEHPLPKRVLATPFLAPTRTWGTAAFDTRRGRILYWGGGHCGYEGSDVDIYDAATRTWSPESTPPSSTERLWNHGVRPGGITFRGEPWMDHGRRVYAYDPVADRLVMVRPILLTAGYQPDWLRAYPRYSVVAPDAVVSQPSAENYWATWTYDLARRSWQLAGPALPGLDTLVTTPLGVMAVNVNWRTRLNDAGYQLPWSPANPPVDYAVYLYRQNRWQRLSEGPSPQNLYELTSLAFDAKRNLVILHGGGALRNELWTFSPATRLWTLRNSSGPTATREAVYLPTRDLFVTLGDGLQAWNPSTNEWKPLNLPLSCKGVGQNRALVYDAARNQLFVVIGAGGDDGSASVHAVPVP
jgi:hypothetical protein